MSVIKLTEKSVQQKSKIMYALSDLMSVRNSNYFSFMNELEELIRKYKGDVRQNKTIVPHASLN